MKAFGSYVLWVALPLLPAILVFRIFPNTALRTDGPLKGLRVDTAGAFVAYFVVFLVLGYPLLHSMVGKIEDGEAPREQHDSAAAPEPTSVDALSKLASSYTSNGDYDRAIAYYSKALDIDPKSPSIFNNRGVNYEATGNYDKAIADYNEAISLNPNYALAFSNRCSARLKAKEYVRAVNDCDRSVQLDPAAVNTYILRANVYREMQKFDDAIRDYDRAIQLDPKSITAIFYQARVYEQAGRIDDALKNYSTIIQAQSQHGHSLEQSLLDQGDDKRRQRRARPGPFGLQ